MTAEVALAIGAGGVAVAGLVIAAVGAVATQPRRPRPGPSTMELGDEPPALVDLVTDEFEVTTEAVPATVLDLAARGWLTIEEPVPGAVRCRIPSREPDDALTGYERQALDHIRELARHGVVPAEALTTGPEAASTSWWRSFAHEVIRDAQDRGLCQPRWPGWLKGLLGLLTTASGGGIVLAWYLNDREVTGDIVTLAVASAVIAFFVWVVGRITTSRSQRGLPAGMQMGSRWLGVRRFMADHGDFARYPAAAVAVWDRYLAYAAALDLAPLAVDQLPLGAEDARHAFSSVSGEWRKVRVRYPRFRPGWGRHPAAAVLVGLLISAAAVGVAWFGFKLFADESLRDEVRNPDPAEEAVELPEELRWVGLGLGLLALPVGAWWAGNVVIGLSDAFARREVEGAVIRTRCRSRYSPLSRLQLTRVVGQKESEPRWYVAVDDGRGDEIAAWSVRRPMYFSVRQGARVRATVSPRLGWVSRIEVLGDQPAAAPATDVLEQAAADLVAARQAAP